MLKLVEEKLIAELHKKESAAKNEEKRIQKKNLAHVAEAVTR